MLLLCNFTFYNSPLLIVSKFSIYTGMSRAIGFFLLFKEKNLGIALISPLPVYNFDEIYCKPLFIH